MVISDISEACKVKHFKNNVVRGEQSLFSFSASISPLNALLSFIPHAVRGRKGGSRDSLLHREVRSDGEVRESCL